MNIPDLESFKEGQRETRRKLGKFLKTGFRITEQQNHMATLRKMPLCTDQCSPVGWVSCAKCRVTGSIPTSPKDLVIDFIEKGKGRERARNFNVREKH